MLDTMSNKEKQQRSNILIKLIQNNSGYSSKNFFLIVVTVVGILLLSAPMVSMYYEIIDNHTITSDLTKMATYITAVVAMFATAGITKAWSEKYERKPGPDGILGTEDDVYVKKSSSYEYTEVTGNEDNSVTNNNTTVNNHYHRR